MSPHLTSGSLVIAFRTETIRYLKRIIFSQFFLSEQSLEAWPKHTSISLEEESESKRINGIEEMSIPSNLKEKIACVVSFLRGPLSKCGWQGCSGKVQSLN